MLSPTRVLEHRRISHQIGALEDEGAVETLASGLDALEHGCRGQDLEGAAQREALIATIIDARLRGRIEDRDAQMSADFGFNGGQIVLQGCSESGGCFRPEKARAKSGGGKARRNLTTCHVTTCEVSARGHQRIHAAVGAFPVRPSRLSR